MQDKPVLISWSGGKDSAVALCEVQKTRAVEALLTTITRDFDDPRLLAQQIKRFDGLFRQAYNAFGREHGWFVNRRT